MTTIEEDILSFKVRISTCETLTLNEINGIVMELTHWNSVDHIIATELKNGFTSIYTPLLFPLIS